MAFLPSHLELQQICHLAFRKVRTKGPDTSGQNYAETTELWKWYGVFVIVKVKVVETGRGGPGQAAASRLRVDRGGAG